MPANQNDLARECEVVEAGARHLYDFRSRVGKAIVERQIQSDRQRRDRLDGPFAVLRVLRGEDEIRGRKPWRFSLRRNLPVESDKLSRLVIQLAARLRQGRSEQRRHGGRARGTLD